MLPKIKNNIIHKGETILIIAELIGELLNANWDSNKWESFPDPVRSFGIFLNIFRVTMGTFIYILKSEFNLAIK